jgi:uncharacterized protein YdgA (DUF945 family)
MEDPPTNMLNHSYGLLETEKKNSNQEHKNLEPTSQSSKSPLFTQYKILYRNTLFLCTEKFDTKGL